MLLTVLKPVHTVADFGDKWRQFVLVAVFGDYRRKVRLLPKTATVAFFSPFSATVAVFGDSHRFRRQCGQGFTDSVRENVCNNSKNVKSHVFGF